ncbi:MAG: hypothetical protein NWR39_01635 [Pseudomonadota bacterium]|nr:hypothetical protein [Pseudomonadota bacterium]
MSSQLTGLPGREQVANPTSLLQRNTVSFTGSKFLNELGKQIARNAECLESKGCSRKQMPSCNGLDTGRVPGTKVSPLRTGVK